MELTNDDATASQMIADLGKEIWIDKPIPHVAELIYCVGPETKVLTADLRWVPASQLKLGQELMGVDEEPSLNGSKRKTRKLRRTLVVNTERVVLPSYLVTLTDGRSVISSADHLWLGTGWEGGQMSTANWIRTDKLRPGGVLRQLLPGTWCEPALYDEGYIAGFLDGEGCISMTGRNTVQFSFAQKEGPILDAVVERMQSAGLVLLRAGTQSGCVSHHTTRVADTIMTLGLFRPNRLLARFNELFEGTGLPNVATRAEVASVEFLGDRELVALGTSTHTFIAEGLISHNCLTRSWMDRFNPLPPTPEETLLFVCGVGLEKVMLDQHRQHIGGCKDGIYYDIDFLDYMDLPGELKTTRISAKTIGQWLCITGIPVKNTKGEVYDMPETWKRQVLSYFYCNEANVGTLGILCLMGNYAPPFPSFMAFRARASYEELEENWAWMCARRDIYAGFVESGEMPTPYQYCSKWECERCKYRLFCEAQTMRGAR